METPDSVELEPNEVLALEQSRAWMQEALASLGDVYLRRENLRREIEEQDVRLLQAERRARETEQQHARVLRTIGDMKALPPGEWFYDPSQKRIVRKGS